VLVDLCFRYLEFLISYSKISQISLVLMLNCVINFFDYHVIQLECAFASIYVAQNGPKMHAHYLLFEVTWVALANTLASFQYYSFMSIKVNDNVQCLHEIKTLFFPIGCFYFH
jgi:hypothetical protein